MRNAEFLCNRSHSSWAVSGHGEPAAAAPLMDAVYDELRRLARRYLAGERHNHTLPPPPW
jgi:hypothetical protein